MQVARWLGAQLYQTSFRPVPLDQYIKVGRQIKDANGDTVITGAGDGGSHTSCEEAACQQKLRSSVSRL